MNGERFGHFEASDYLELHEPTKDPAVFEERLAGFAEKYQLAPALTDALRSDRAQLHYTDIPELDSGIPTNLAAGKDFTLSQINRQYTRAIQGNLSLAGVREDDYTRHNLRGAHKIVGDVWRTTLQEEDRSGWLKAVEEQQESGLERSSIFGIVDDYLGLNYFLELPHTDNGTEYKGEAKEDFRDIFTDAELAQETITQRDIATRLQELGRRDLSKSTLDARFANTTALAQVVLVEGFLSDVMELGQTGGNKERRAMALLRQYQGTLFDDNLAGKRQMTEVIAATFKHAADIESHPFGKQVLQMFNKGTTNRVHHLDDIFNFFEKVYDTLGYELPPMLQERHIEPIAAISTQKTIGEEARANAEAARQRAEAETTFNEHSEQLAQAVEVMARPWHLSAKARKQAQLGDLQGVLVKGYTNALGRKLLDGIDKEEAQRLTDLLCNLDRRVTQQGAAETQQFAEASVTIQHDLEHQLTSLKAFGQMHGIHRPLPEVLRLQGYLSHLRDNWQVYRQVIADSWPQHQGRAAAGRLQQFLFEQQEPATSPTEALAPLKIGGLAINEGGTNIAESTATIAEQLDQILLPPEATAADLERELRRIGAEQITVSKVEWQRLQDLVTVRDQFDGVLYRSKERSLGGAPPYFVAIVNLEGQTYAVAESPVFGNATYIVAEKHAAGTWLEVLELSKKDARESGAYRIVHSDKAPHGPEHLEKIYNKIIDLHETR